MRLALLWVLAWAAAASEPVTDAWIRARPSTAPAAVRPEVQAVSVTEDAVEVRSAGLSLIDLGPLASPPVPGNQVRQFTFRIPRHPQPAAVHAGLAPGAAGVFVNGVPVYNLFEANSYNGQNLWHFDPVAATRRAGHGYSPGILARLIADSSRHSPILGFAIDGYPIYGPWGFAKGGLRRMRSSYRLRRVEHRTAWADGTVLTPGQYGPDAGADYPAGTFAEDYEYAAGSGDLDEFNGRFAVTPEYPHGTYAYFLTTDDAGDLAFPYLLAGRYYGRVAADPAPCASRVCFTAAEPTAGRPVRLSFTIPHVRTLEYVHEQPIHLVVVSDDLSEFGHIHPEREVGDRFETTYTFAHGGHYRLYAEFTEPGAATEQQAFDLEVAGESRPAVPLGPPTAQFGELHAGEDVELRFALPENLEPYLGAWAHVVILDERQRHFIHAHPMESIPAAPGGVHVHNAPLGSSPAAIRVQTGFPEAGTYKIWLQVQRQGRMIATPFVVQAGAPRPRPVTRTAIPPGAIRVAVGRGGFEPARIEAPAGRPVTLALTRSAEPNCATKIAIPAAGIVRDLPLGATTIVKIPAMPAAELSFACGMGMLHGMLVLR
jgi:hypothetical protein